jgi:hypothetical protein
MAMNDATRGSAWGGELQYVVVHTLQLYPEPVIVGNDEAEITYLRSIHAGIINFVNDTAAEGEPKA